MWHKQIIENKLQNLLSFSAWSILLASLYTESILLFVFACFFIVFDISSKLYMKYVANDFMIENEKQRVKLFAGETGIMKLRINHHGRLPIVNGVLRLTVDNVISCDSYKTSVIKNQLDILMPISVAGREDIEISIPVQARKRGLARIRSVNLTINHPFGFGMALLENNIGINHEVIIYPSPIAVEGLEKMAPKQIGNYYNRSSLFVDHTSTIGTRDYEQTDPFNRIHWKATARTTNLQTKILEPTSQFAWTLIVNVKDGNGIIGNLENILSYVAYICQIATKKNIEFQLFINIRSSGKTPFYYLPLGSGKAQLSKVLEIVARVHKQSVLIPFEKMLSYINKHHKLSAFTITYGPVTHQEEIIYQGFARQGTENYKVIDNEDKGYIVKMPGSSTVKEKVLM